MFNAKRILLLIFLVPLAILVVFSPSIFAYINWDQVINSKVATSYDQLFGNLMHLITIIYFLFVGQATAIVIAIYAGAIYFDKGKKE